MDLPQALQAREALLRELAADREAHGPAGAHLFGVPRLERFLEGNDGSVPEAAAHFRKMLQWRQEVRMEEKRLAVVGKPWSPDSVPGLRRLFELMGVDASSFSPDGHLIWVQCDGHARLPELLAIPEEELFHTLHLMCELRQEHLDSRSLEWRKLIKLYQVRDLSGLSISKIVRDGLVMKTLRKVLGTVNLAFPESVHKIVLVNVPQGFGVLWAVLTPMFNARIRQKFHFVGKDFPVELVALTGSLGLEALVRARGDLAPLPLPVDSPKGADTLEISGGHMSYASFRLSQADTLEWSFEVQPKGASLHFRVLFFPDATEPDAPAPGHTEVVRPADVAGTVTGEFAAASAGLAWFSWSNASGWAASRRVERLRIVAAANADEDGQQATPRSTRRPLADGQRPTSCLAWIGTRSCCAARPEKGPEAEPSSRLASTPCGMDPFLTRPAAPVARPVLDVQKPPSWASPWATTALAVVALGLLVALGLPPPGRAPSVTGDLVRACTSDTDCTYHGDLLLEFGCGRWMCSSKLRHRFNCTGPAQLGRREIFEHLVREYPLPEDIAILANIN